MSLSLVERAYSAASASTHPSVRVGLAYAGDDGLYIQTCNTALDSDLHDLDDDMHCVGYIHAEVMAAIRCRLGQGRIAITLEPCAPCARVLLASGFRGELIYDQPWFNPAYRTYSTGLTGPEVLERAGVKVTRARTVDGGLFQDYVDYQYWYESCMKAIGGGETHWVRFDKHVFARIDRVFTRAFDIPADMHNPYVHLSSNGLIRNLKARIHYFADNAKDGSVCVADTSFAIANICREGYRRAVSVR